ncbi:G-type lectin S-receptor-like serine/threonine-protein kinase LECRK2 [Syzygium oleosum]|uniref:G-type lectin S-receptor-like serine/threonine-protein kinase LECRK2 n=1 Tax=Syzygium oleosum TaxID=219896 RepID=UPI0011D2AAEA|nr:G-type lectin S-receptor-like serine/threonine-protein kinase LECRK2 [Syzygium oleosum]
MQDSRAQTNIAVGSSLTATNGNSSWLSPSEDFAFGFGSLSNGDTKNDRLFLLSIWYNNIPSETIIWFGNQGRPVPANSKLELTSGSGLVLTNPQGEELWKSENISGTVLHAVFNDTGNFVILDSSSEVLWQSFDNPSDTLLPSQVLGKNILLSSRQSEESFSRGRFQLWMLDSGNLVLNTINLPSNYTNEAYYSAKTGSSNSPTAGKELVFSNSGSLFVSREDGEKVYLSQGKIPSTSDFYHRVTLDFDGVLTQYVHPKNSGSSGSWRILWCNLKTYVAMFMSVMELAFVGTTAFANWVRITGQSVTAQTNSRCSIPVTSMAVAGLISRRAVRKIRKG